MLEPHVHLVQAISVAGKVLQQELIVITMVAEHTMDVEERYVIGMLLIIFVKILQLGVELGDWQQALKCLIGVQIQKD